MKKKIILAIVLSLCVTQVLYASSKVAEKQWNTTYAGTAKGEDTPIGISVDYKGNACVVGVSVSESTGVDAVVLKYDADAHLIWSQRFDADGKDDLPIAMTTDKAGNVYLVAASKTVDDGDIVTVKYDADGKLQWVRRYDAGTKNADLPRAITVTSTGDVIVSGSSIGNETWLDYVTIKYTHDGQLQWVRRYDRGVGANDMVTALMTDVAGNIFITGTSEDETGQNDIVTIMYDAYGNQKWVSKFDGNTHGEDVSVDLKVNKSGDVFVAGWSEDLTNGKTDYLTLKYNNSGSVVWSRTYGYSHLNAGEEEDFGMLSRAIGLSLDASGNSYICGSTDAMGEAESMLLISYSPQGTLRWKKTYDRFEPISMICDDKGAVFTTGRYHPEIIMDEKGNIHMDYSNGAIAVKHTKLGQQSLIVPTDPNIIFEPRQVAVDRQGAVYVAGTKVNDDGTGDIHLMKFSGTVEDKVTKEVPGEYVLHQNYPNPFNPITTISFTLPNPATVTLKISNVLGQEVASLLNQAEMEEGIQEVEFDAKKLASGVYFYRLEATGISDPTKGFMEVKKMLLLR